MATSPRLIAIASFGLGNVRALANIYQRHEIPSIVATSPEQLLTATHVILPGVGAFDWAMERLNASGLRSVLDKIALEFRRPVLGICVGMQMMAEGSDEGQRPGLGWIAGHVEQLPLTHNGRPVALPHMGWNDIAHDVDPIFADLESDALFYFLHSYRVVPRDKVVTIATADYAGPFTCAMRSANLVGVQFHPEKSHHWGERILLNFARQP